MALKEKYDQVERKTDSFLERIKASPWTAAILFGAILLLVAFAVLADGGKKPNAPDAAAFAEAHAVSRLSAYAGGSEASASGSQSQETKNFVGGSTGLTSTAP